MKFCLGITLAVVALSLGTGCSTIPPAKSERMGFFSRLSSSESNLRSSSSSSVRTFAQRNPAAQAKSQSDDPPKPDYDELKKISWKWPLARMEVTSPFGTRGDGFHEGVDLRAKKGTPVYAAQSGKVLFSGSGIRGYGKMVVISHRNGIASVYAHNSKLLVRKGHRVIQGQRIAISGASGHAYGPHLHFEIRHRVSAVDPMKVLPAAMRKTVSLSKPKRKLIAAK